MQQSTAFHLFGGQNKEKPNLPIDNLTQSNTGLKKSKVCSVFLLQSISSVPAEENTLYINS